VKDEAFVVHPETLRGGTPGCWNATTDTSARYGPTWTMTRKLGDTTNGLRQAADSYASTEMTFADTMNPLGRLNPPGGCPPPGHHTRERSG
jgi:hypothetical protein